MASLHKAAAAVEFKAPEPLAKHTLHSGYFHSALKAWQYEGSGQVLSASNIVFPIFVTDDDDAKQEIKALPGQYRWGVNKLAELLDPLVKKGLQSILIFGVLGNSKLKDNRATFATHKESPVAKTLHLCAQRYPALLLQCDVCLCGYTDHGHCGIVKKDSIDNTPSIQRIAELAVFYAQHGAHVVAPSDMMDGRIAAIKTGLRAAKLDSTVAVMSYAAKFASVFYGPFREAAASGMQFGDRTKYQLPPNARGLALRAVARDVEEGADMVMVKPGGPYLDLVRDVKNSVHVPIAIYQVSGEYAMLWHGAQAGAFGLKEAVWESVLCMRRAGAGIIITYYADMLLDQIQERYSAQPVIRARL
jgi:porphobilinogen synthase